jgi:hypothetical protein
MSIARAIPRKLLTSLSIEPQEGRGAHARIRTGDLFITKELLEDHFPIVLF